MKRKNGFTLIELLAVIAIIGLLIGISVPSTLLISNKIKVKLYENKVKNIEMAFEHYIEDHKEDCQDPTYNNLKNLKVSELVKNNYLKPDDNTNKVINPVDNKENLASKSISEFDVSEINIEQICASYPKEEIPHNPDKSTIFLNQKIIEDNEKYKTGFSPTDCGLGDGEPSQAKNCTQQSGKGFFIAEDDTGPSYYFRGAMTNNYVKFGRGKTTNNPTEHDLVWKIIRINGSRTIRLMNTEYIGNVFWNRRDQDFDNYNRNNYQIIDYKDVDRFYVGFTYDNKTACTKEKPCTVIYNNQKFTNQFEGKDSTIKGELETWYNENLKEEDEKITNEIFCNDTSLYKPSGNVNYVFGAAIRLNYNPTSPLRYPTSSLKCPDPTPEERQYYDSFNNAQGKITINYGGVYKLKIGLLTADEINLAGVSINYNSWLIGDNKNYLYPLQSSWTMSPNVNQIPTGNDYFGYSMITVEGEHNNLSYLSIDSYNSRNETAKVGYHEGYLDNKLAVYPVINLKENTPYSGGTGTSEDPYVVK